MKDRVEALARELERRLPPSQVSRGAPSAARTTYRIGGPFALEVVVDDRDALIAVATAVRRHEVAPLVVGRGSNLLVADSGFDGAAIVLGDGFEVLEFRDDGRVDAGAAVALPVLARRSAGAGYGGLEFFVGIPGSVGGAVRMNAGGHGRETKDVLFDAEILDGRSLTVTRLPRAALAFGYRTSAVRDDDVVLGATFETERDDAERCTRRIDEIVQWRRQHQPGGSNAGSVFRNPDGDAAGRLIDACHLKGMRVGDVVVSDKHANFFVAGPNASASDVVELIATVRGAVARETGVVLVPEIRLVGFGDSIRELSPDAVEGSSS